MTILKRINSFRRKLTHSITNKIGKPIPSESHSVIQKDSIKTILVTRPNHRLGNLLLITPLLQELESTFPNSKIDVFLKGGLGPIILKNYKNVNEIIALPRDHFRKLPGYIYTWFRLRKKKYDLVINAVPNSSSGRLSTKLSRSKYKLFGDEEQDYKIITDNYEHIAKLPICYLRQAIIEKQSNLTTEFPMLDIKLSVEEINAGKKILERITKSEKKVISIFTYATGEKCHSKLWWKEFYGAFQTEFPKYFILEILPKENVSQIDFDAATYYSKNLREICSVIANTEAFIGADSGMMHLAVASKIPVIGLFNITDSKKYQPYGKENIVVNTIQVPILDIIEKLKNILNLS